MTAGVVTFKVKRESSLGALHLVKSAPGRISPSSPLAPVMLYFEGLAASGKRTQSCNLVRAARLLSGDSEMGLDYEWRDLRSGHLEFLRGSLKGKGYSPSVINSTISALRGVARWAWHLGQMALEDYERLRDVRLVRASEERRRPARALAAPEIVALFESCERDGSLCAVRDACLLALLYGGGLRRNEACELMLSAYVPRSHTLTLSGKGNRTRSVYFAPGGARRALNAWLRVRGAEPGALLCPVSRHQGEVIIKHLHPNAVYCALKRRALSAGIESFTPHDLRRSLGTHLRDKGVDIDMVRQLLGHAEIRTTQIYLLTSEKQKREASLKIKVPFRSARGGGKGKRKRRGRSKSSWRQQVRSKLKG